MTRMWWDKNREEERGMGEILSMLNARQKKVKFAALQVSVWTTMRVCSDDSIVDTALSHSGLQADERGKKM